MAIFYTAGETKKRPGIYQRYKNIGSATIAGASNGIAAAVFQSDWGSLNEVVNLTEYSQIASNFGSTGTTDVLQEIFNGGASTVRAVRAGTGGTAGTATIKDTSTTPVDAVTLTLKYVGSHAFQFVFRDNVADATKRDLILYDGTTVVEKFTISASAAGEVDALISAGSSSKYINFAKVSGYTGTGKLAVTAQTAFTAGTNPTITNESYSAAFTALEAYDFNAIAVDTNDTSVHAILQGFVDRIFENGKMTIGIVGEPTSVAYDTRLAHSAAFNDYKIVYVGSGWTDSTANKYEGYLAAARICGMVAAIASNASLTHKVITGAVNSMEMLTNSQLDDAVDHGMMVFSVNSSNQIWIDYAINTLVTLSDDDDAGWKKIRRVKTRYEIMQRCSDTTDDLVGNINNDTDGRTSVKQAIQGVLNTMVSEKKLLSGATVSDDANNAAKGDSAWFIISADDIDSLEKMYFTYQFRFSSAS